MKKKIALIMALALSVTTVFAGCGAKDDQKQRESGSGTQKTFTVGFDQDFPPMGFVGDDGEYTGFDLDLAKEVADRLDMKFVPKPISWDAKDMELSSGGIDCIWNGFTMTGREDKYTWSEPYLNNEQVFVVKKDSGIKTQADLAGKVVDVQTDSSAQKALEQQEKLQKSFKELKIVADYNTAFMDLESGAVDAIAMDIVVAKYQIEQRKADFVLLDDALASEEYAVGFLKGNDELRDKVQKTLEEMAEDGTIKKISEKMVSGRYHDNRKIIKKDRGLVKHDGPLLSQIEYEKREV